MLASGRKPVARRVDVSRRPEPTKQAVRARRALVPVEAPRAGKLSKAAVGVLASTALVGGLAWSGAEPAAAKPIGYGWPKLSKGESGRAVVRLQRELSAYGPNVADTGYFGKQTKKRVKQLQRKNGWRVTGVAGNRVWHELLTDGNRVNSPAMVGGGSHRSKTPKLHRGDEGRAVKRLQRELNNYGPHVPVTGYFGDITADRVRNLKKREDFKKTGSVVGKKVWRFLLNDNNKPYNPGGGGSGDGGGSSDVNNSVWDRLAECESGGNWHINTGNGYYGGLQFSLSTWRAYGGRGMPHEQSREEQIRIAEKVQNSQGWGAWPACSSKLGLR